MEANSSHTNRHRDPGLAQDVQRRPCDEARSEHEYLAATREKVPNQQCEFLADCSVHGTLLLRGHIDKFRSYMTGNPQYKASQHVFGMLQ